jgi:hypothetical protein
VNLVEIDFWGTIWLTVLALSLAAIVFLLAASVSKKAGFSKWYGLLAFVPVINIVALYFFAFSRWPNETK